jgi:hypothetical protein
MAFLALAVGRTTSRTAYDAACLSAAAFPLITLGHLSGRGEIHALMVIGLSPCFGLQWVVILWACDTPHNDFLWREPDGYDSRNCRKK